MSKGAYDITGQAAGWVQVPHSEAWYGAARRGQPMQDNAGHPDNPRQVAQLVVDAVDALARRQPDFPGPTTTSRTRATPTPRWWSPPRTTGAIPPGSSTRTLDTPVEDLSLGVEFVVRRVAGSNPWAVIGVRAAQAENAP